MENLLCCTRTPSQHGAFLYLIRRGRGNEFLRIIDEKSLIKKYWREISILKQELDQLRKGIKCNLD
ncbi:unnamed protein product [Ilex paraguariensis]|uniref:Uncharacterized protein n=1 Tax=Ilex paraguariensis TaxID=185542 RepID=A0ABC8U1A3_9AQUA